MLNDDAQGIFFAEEDALETGERAALDADGLADADERPGLGRQAGSQDGLDIVDFGLRDGNGVAAEANDGGDAGGDEHGQAAVVIETAEHKSGEQAAPPGTDWHILFQPAATKRPGHRLLLPRLHTQSEPLQPRRHARQRSAI
jgi:hypothetical protein